MWLYCYSAIRSAFGDMHCSSKGAIAVGTTVLFAIELGLESFPLILLRLYLQCIKLSNTKLFLQLDSMLNLSSSHVMILWGLQVGDLKGQWNILTY